MMAFSTASRGMSLLVVLILSFKMTIQQPLGEPSPEMLHRVKRVVGGIRSQQTGPGTVISGKGDNDHVIKPVLFNYDLSREELAWLHILQLAEKANHGSSTRGGSPPTHRTRPGNQGHAHVVRNEHLNVVNPSPCQSLNNCNNQGSTQHQHHHHVIPHQHRGQQQPSSGPIVSITHGGHSHLPRGNVGPPKPHDSVHTHHVHFQSPDPHVYIAPNGERIPIFSD